MKRAAIETADAVDARLLSAAIDVFLEKGFAAATVDEIAARAKASKLTFYNRYGNKEALFEAVVTRETSAQFAALSGARLITPSLREFLSIVANRLHAAFLKKETVALVRVLHAEAERFPGLANQFENAGPANCMKMLSEEFERYMTLGTMRRADLQLASEHFMHLSLGELTRRTLLGVLPPVSKAETSRRIEEGIAAFLRAYSNTEAGWFSEPVVDSTHNVWCDGGHPGQIECAKQHSAKLPG